MKVAVAGPGLVAHYLLEELPKEHDVVVLTRSAKDWVSKLNIPQRITDYSVSSIAEHIADRDVLISAVALYDMSNVQVHLSMLEALKQSPHCKKFVPSEWGGNIEDYPDQPYNIYESHEPVRQALRDQNEVQWTLLQIGWFMDYVVPAQNRHFVDVGDLWPMDYENKVMNMYGKGKNLVDLSAGHDVAKALSELVKHEQWEPYTYIAGEQITWQQLYEILKKRDPAWQTKHTSLTDSIRKIIANEGEWGAMLGWFEVHGHYASTASRPEKIQEHRKKYFSKIKFRGVEELMDEAAANPQRIV